MIETSTYVRLYLKCLSERFCYINWGEILAIIKEAFKTGITVITRQPLDKTSTAVFIILGSIDCLYKHCLEKEVRVTWGLPDHHFIEITFIELNNKIYLKKVKRGIKLCNSDICNYVMCLPQYIQKQFNCKNPLWCKPLKRKGDSVV